MGAKGGVGATTVACTLAAELCRQTTQKVLLADLDMHKGSVSFLLGIESKYSIADAISNVDRLDQKFWEDIVTQKGKDLSVVASPDLLGRAETDPGAVQRVLKVALPFYQWAVLDLGPLNPFSRRLLGNVDEVLIVTTSAIPALYEAKRMIDGFVNGGLDRNRFQLIANQGNEESLSQPDLKKMFGVPVCAILPNDSQELHNACIERRLPNETSKIRKEIARLAQSLAGIQEIPTKRGLFRFLPFGERWGKTSRQPGLAH
jgi:pilus assembly protein CpaE